MRRHAARAHPWYAGEVARRLEIDEAGRLEQVADGVLLIVAMLDQQPAARSEPRRRADDDRRERGKTVAARRQRGGLLTMTSNGPESSGRGSSPYQSL